MDWCWTCGGGGYTGGSTHHLQLVHEFDQELPALWCLTVQLHSSLHGIETTCSKGQRRPGVSVSQSWDSFLSPCRTQTCLSPCLSSCLSPCLSTFFNDRRPTTNLVEKITHFSSDQMLLLTSSGRSGSLVWTSEYVTHSLVPMSVEIMSDFGFYWFNWKIIQTAKSYLTKTKH